MIYTVTLNPALDRTLWIEKIQPDDSNRIEREQRYAGGKGTDVSRVLTALGVSNKALGFVGGFAGEELEGREEIISAARGVHEQGTGIVLFSMGARGIIMVGEREQYWAYPPEIEVENTIGAGDSAMAGSVYGLAEGRSHKEALIYAVSAGTATTLRPGTALCQKEDFLN